MRSVHGMLGAAALLAAFGLVAGPFARAEKKPAEKAEAPKTTPDEQAVRDIGTAYGLIDYGRRTEDAKAVLVGANMLLSIVGPEGKPDKVEGAGDGKVPSDKEMVEGLLKEALAMKGSKTEAVQKLAADLKEKLAENPRGTPTKGTKWTGIINPNGSVTLHRNFIGKQYAHIVVSKDFNKGVPLHIHVYDPAGKLLHHRLAHYFEYDILPPATGSYKIVLTNVDPKVGVLATCHTN